MIPPLHQQPHLRLNEVAKILNTPARTVRAWANSGKLPYYKPGKAFLFQLADITAFMALYRRRSEAELAAVAVAKYQELNAPSTNLKRS